MGSGGVDWGTAIAVLVAGIVVGSLLAGKMRASGAGALTTPDVPLERRDLLGKRDVLLRRLAELEDAAAESGPEQLARERYALELETARVLREIDRAPAPARKDAPEEAGAASTRGPTGAAVPAAPPGGAALRGFLWGTGTMVALGGLVFFVTQAARPRDPGGSPTGEVPEAVTPGPASAEISRLQDHLQTNPDDLDARLALARELLERQDMMGVWNEAQYVLARSPGNPRASVYQALVRVAMGQPEVALATLEQAIAAAPNMIEAYTSLALAQRALGRQDAAARTMAEARQRFPEQVAALVSFEAQLQAAQPDLAAPLPASPTPRPAAAAPREGLAGLVDLDPTLRGQISGGVVFLIVREAGVSDGPPLAVQRLAPLSFPIRFEIGERDSMTGEALPDPVLIEARLDADGDPSSRPPSDPRARADSVALGTGDLSLVLRREK